MLVNETNLMLFIYLAGLTEDFLYFLSLLYLIIRLAYFTVLTLYVQWAFPFSIAFSLPLIICLRKGDK